MPTVRAAMESMEASLFVGRQAESEEFVRWLGGDPPNPDLLQVTGHAGIGKSALLRAFARIGRSQGRSPVVLVDGEAIAPTESEFLGVASDIEGVDLATAIGDGPALVIIDGIEELAPLTRWLMTEVIPSLDGRSRVVLAGRQAVEPAWNPKLAMRTIGLGSLDPGSAVEYLARRGLSGGVIDEILGAAGGYPLALSLAADLAVQRGVTRFEKVPEWSLVLQNLVGELLKDAPGLRSLTEAAAVVRQFNEPTLAAIAGLDDPDEAFAQLCAVSFIRPTRHGLTLHEDARRVVIEDLKWRNPDRLGWLRRRARAYYRDRIRQRLPDEEWLVVDRMYLWEHTARATYFPDGEPWSMWVEPGGSDDLEELLDIQSEFVAALEAGTPMPILPPPEECSAELLQAIIELPGTEVRIARSSDGRAHGYGFTLPISRESLSVLPADGAISTLVRRGLPVELVKNLPATSEGATVAYLSAAAVRGERAVEASGALSADWFRVVLQGDRFLVCNGDAVGGQITEALGGLRIPGIGESSVEPRRPLDGFVVDIGRIGPDAWLEAVTSGLPIPPVLSDEEFKRELHSVLVGWPDDSRLSDSPLAAWARLQSPPDITVRPADHLRTVVRGALAAARHDAPDLEEAFRAIELAYLERKLSHELIAERLHVSRTTFYRLLHRGEREIVARFVGEQGV